MNEPLKAQTTELLREGWVERSDASAAPPELMEVVYHDLRRLAGSYLRRERHSHTLSATALVHEAYERLVDQSRVDWRGRSHFFAIAAQAMRRILIDHARRHRRAKRGGDWQRVTLDPATAVEAGRSLELQEILELDDALVRLAHLDPRQARVVELRCFGGMSVAEVAGLLGVSKRSVDRDWTHARSWLRRELSGGSGA